jgi:hypothetical protein
MKEVPAFLPEVGGGHALCMVVSHITFLPACGNPFWLITFVFHFYGLQFKINFVNS